MPYIIKIDADRIEGGSLVPQWMHILIPDSRVTEHFLVTQDRWLVCLYGCGTQAPLFRMLSQLIAGVGIIAFDFNTRTVVEQEGLTCPVLQQLFYDPTALNELFNDYSSQAGNAKSAQKKQE